MNSVSAGSRSRVASAKSVPSTFETNRNRHRSLGVVTQSLVRHYRAEVRSSDSDVDDVSNRPAGSDLAIARSHLVANEAMRSSTSCTSGTTLTPSTR